MTTESRIVSLREIEEHNFFDADMVQIAIQSVAKAHIPTGMEIDPDRSFLTVVSIDVDSVSVTVSLVYVKSE